MKEEIGWRKIPLKWMFIGRTSGAWGEEPELENSIVCIRAADFITEKIRHAITGLTRRKYEKYELDNKQLRLGDLIIEKSGGGENQPVGRVVVFQLDEPATCSNFLERIRVNGTIVDVYFAGYLLYSLWVRKAVIPFIKQTTGIQNLDIEEYFSLKVDLPPINVQHAIAHYLDRETAYIDALINAKQQLLELLAEKRQTLISHTVTHGLNSYTTMRSTEIDWLDGIPTNWQVAPLKRWVKTKITDGPHETPDHDPEGIPFVSAEAVQNERINFDSRWGNIPLELHKKYAQKLLPRRNDIFMVKSGATTGKLAYVDVDTEFNVWSPLALIRANEKKVLSKFLFILLHSDYVQRQVRATWSAGTQPNISMGAIEELIIIVPPLEEQRVIVDYLDREAGKIDKLLEATQSSIALLRERRVALISAAVTGQIEIPEASCN